MIDQEMAFVGDIGTKIEIDLGEDVSAATLAQINVRKPDGSTQTWAATVDGTSIYHTTVAGDLSVSGSYLLQPYIEMGGWSGHGKPVSLPVGANL